MGPFWYKKILPIHSPAFLKNVFVLFYSLMPIFRLTVQCWDISHHKIVGIFSNQDLQGPHKAGRLPMTRILYNLTFSKNTLKWSKQAHKIRCKPIILNVGPFLSVSEMVIHWAHGSYESSDLGITIPFRFLPSKKVCHDNIPFDDLLKWMNASLLSVLMWCFLSSDLLKV